MREVSSCRCVFFLVIGQRVDVNRGPTTPCSVVSQMRLGNRNESMPKSRNNFAETSEMHGENSNCFFSVSHYKSFFFHFENTVNFRNADNDVQLFVAVTLITDDLTSVWVFIRRCLCKISLKLSKQFYSNDQFCFVCNMGLSQKINIICLQGFLYLLSFLRNFCIIF